MNTLIVSDIFKNLEFYKENYLSILSTPEQYFIPVSQAYIEIWPLGHIDLYLGDLLQLWFSEKWLIHDACFRLATPTQEHRAVLQRPDDLFLYQLTGNALTGTNTSQVWSKTENSAVEVCLSTVFRYFADYKSTAKLQQNEAECEKFKSAI